MDVNKLEERDTLCWKCERSGGGAGCPWVDAEPPKAVPGWQVKFRKRSCHKQMLVAYVVVSCPLFCTELKREEIADEVGAVDFESLMQQAGRLYRTCGHR